MCCVGSCGVRATIHPLYLTFNDVSPPASIDARSDGGHTVANSSVLGACPRLGKEGVACWDQFAPDTAYTPERSSLGVAAARRGPLLYSSAVNTHTAVGPKSIRATCDRMDAGPLRFQLFFVAYRIPAGEDGQAALAYSDEVLPCPGKVDER